MEDRMRVEVAWPAGVSWHKAGDVEINEELKP